MLKQDDHGELCTFTDSLEHSINCLKDSGQHNIGTFITSLITNKFHKKMNKLLLNYTRDIKKVPDEDTLLQFLYASLLFQSVLPSRWIYPKNMPNGSKLQCTTFSPKSQEKPGRRVYYVVENDTCCISVQLQGHVPRQQECPCEISTFMS